MRRQSDHLDDYRAALDRLAAAGFLYPCFCSRKEIEAEIAALARAPQGPEGRSIPAPAARSARRAQAARIADGKPYALRLDVRPGARGDRPALLA